MHVMNATQDSQIDKYIANSSNNNCIGRHTYICNKNASSNMAILIAPT